MPPVVGIPLGAYISVGLLLVGGITALPWAVALVYDRLVPALRGRLLPLLAVERARRVRESAAVAVSGVVASLSLAVALTVMVASFRDSVAHWLDVVLPADLYLRTADLVGSGRDRLVLAGIRAGGGPASTACAGSARRAPARCCSIRRCRRWRCWPARSTTRPAPCRWWATLRPAPRRPDPHLCERGRGRSVRRAAGHRVRAAGQGLRLRRLDAAPVFFVAGVWRDYVRQSGAIAMDRARLRAPDRRPARQRPADLARTRRRRGAGAAGASARWPSAKPAAPAGSTSLRPGELRAISLRIFDRSFAVTYWLQAVAIGIGLFGVAASFSAQVLARRKEFGLLAHLGLTRRQILAVVAGEGAAWTVIGSVAGLALGLAVSVVLVHVVNPQSFHWTMDLLLPWVRLLALCAAVVAAGTVTAWLAGRAAAGRDAVLAVKEDW